MSLRGLFLCGVAPCFSCTLWSAQLCSVPVMDWRTRWTPPGSCSQTLPEHFPEHPPASHACDVPGLLADKKTVNIMFNPLPEGLNVIAKMKAHLRKEVAELEKLALDMYSVATEIKEIISNAESFKTVTEFQSQIVAVEGKPLLEHVE